jgi:hypothetical protein
MQLQLQVVKNKLFLLAGFTDKVKLEHNTHSEQWTWFIRILQNCVSKGHR